MFMDELSISEFKATCLKVIERVRSSGRSLLITKNGEPAALVTPPPKRKAGDERLFGKMRDQGKITGDIVSPIEDAGWEVLK